MNDGLTPWPCEALLLTKPTATIAETASVKVSAAPLMLNRRVIANLTAEGDDLSKPRTIDHMAYLPSAEAAAALSDDLQKQGFIVDEPKVEGGSISLSFKRPDRPDQIDEVELSIARLVRQLGGDYDGWGSAVTK